MKQELVKQIEELLVKNYTEVREEAKAGKYAQLRDETEAAYKEYRKWSAAHGYASCEEMTTRCRQLKAYRDYLLAMMRKTDEEIKAEAKDDAVAFANNTEKKCVKHIGAVTCWDDVELTFGTHYAPMLNGVVSGEGGKCRIYTIEKGGWNIKKLHAAVLVKKIK